MAKLMFEIVRSLFESDRESDFVGIGNLTDEKDSYHAGFVIRYQKKLYEFHYSGTEIEFIPLENDYYHKITDTIIPEEIPAFIAQCQNIKKKANPKYGYFYSGESYDSDGNHLNSIDRGERMTCVGFCLNVLKGFLEEDYLEYSDWTSESHKKEGYLAWYCDKYKLDSKKLQSSHRRITPRECLTSCFYNRLPIRKSDIDKKINDVNEHFIARMRTQN